MNRKKKINQALKKKLKQKNAKLHKTNKPKYISKAKRAEMLAEQQDSEDNETFSVKSSEKIRG